MHIYGDIPDLDVERAIEIARDTEKWKHLGLRNVATLTRGGIAE